jgi:hypothetical protein
VLKQIKTAARDSAVGSSFTPRIIAVENARGDAHS